MPLDHAQALGPKPCVLLWLGLPGLYDDKTVPKQHEARTSTLAKPLGYNERD